VRAPHNARGFTLIELLVALVISGILAGVIFQLLLGQGRISRVQTAREEVQQNARAALDIVTAELRGAPAAAIQEATETSIRFHLPRIWGLLCESTSLSGDAFIVRFPKDEDGDVLPAPAAGAFPYGRSDWGLAVAGAGGYAIGNRLQNGGGSINVCGGANGLGADVPSANVDDRDIRMQPLALLAGSAPAGASVFLYEEVEYDVGTAPAVGGADRWLRRSRGHGAGGSPVMEPLAGPLDPGSEGGGVRFRYYAADGSRLPTPVANPAGIARITVIVGMQSRSRAGSQHDVQQDSAVVFLRNS
jgi:prepilin-type N-terminal cleavage/methylation domain-containing protein